MHNACRPWSMDSPSPQPAPRHARSCNISRWLPQWRLCMLQWPPLPVHPELRLRSHKERGVLVDINTKEQCLSLGKVNISVRRQKPAEAIFLYAGKRSCKHKAAHSKETDDLCKPSRAKPAVKPARPSAQRLWAEGEAAAKKTISGLWPQRPRSQVRQSSSSGFQPEQRPNRRVDFSEDPLSYRRHLQLPTVPTPVPSILKL